MPETPTIGELEAQVEADWERNRQTALTAEAARRLRSINTREQMREHERHTVEQQRREFAAQCNLARKAHLALYGARLAGQLDPAKSYDLIRLENLPALTGYLAFSSPEAAASARESLRGSILYADPEGGHRAVSGITLGQIVTRESLLAVDPKPADLAALASQVECHKAERHKAESAVLEREREDAEAEHLRKKYGAPVT